VAEYSRATLTEVENIAQQFGIPDEMQARFAREDLGLDRTGLTLYELAPSFRIPFGHKHEDHEEVYVVVEGSARIKIEDEVLDLGRWDAVRVSGDAMRNLEAGPEGARILAFGERAGQEASELVQGWWSD
jgi:uncharacterized cupin superfamily protein